MLEFLRFFTTSFTRFEAKAVFAKNKMNFVSISVTRAQKIFSNTLKKYAVAKKKCFYTNQLSFVKNDSEINNGKIQVTKPFLKWKHFLNL